MASQSYGGAPSRNQIRAAGGPAASNSNAVFTNGDKGSTGSAGGQGAGVLPNKVSVPLPGTDKTQPAYNGGMAKAPGGFKGGVIPGKI